MECSILLGEFQSVYQIKIIVTSKFCAFKVGLVKIWWNRLCYVTFVSTNSIANLMPLLGPSMDPKVCLMYGTMCN